ncbi:hypothetical protein CTI12_AA518500 [Artemisia annua]|uniref:CCHC-type domain-containing protein n=1 Tax=Artemisia annua TaxID=35608 RepID=A0A2U1L8N3_ARTAN|nr:hypothetical protein CTI12_AA518500 [Artemisia annua]
MSNSPTETYLIGKVIADNHIVHKQSVVSILSKAWKNYSLISISPWKNNFFIFTFENKAAASKVISNSPWSVMGFYVALQPWDSNKTLNEIEFNKGQFWVQAHDLPLGLLTSEYATTIAQSLGTLLSLDCHGEGLQTDRDFLRFRVELNIRKPLVPGLFIPRSEGKESWVTLKYERLSDFCYRCGCLGHCRESCTNDVIAKFSGKWSQDMRTSTVRNLSPHTHQPSPVHVHKETDTVPKSHHIFQSVESPTISISSLPNNSIPKATTSTVTNTTSATTTQSVDISTPKAPTNSTHTHTEQTPSTKITQTSTSVEMLPATTTSAYDCTNYYVTEPPEPDTSEHGSIHFPIPTNPFIDVTLASALSRLAMKRRHDEESPSMYSVNLEINKGALLGVCNILKSFSSSFLPLVSSTAGLIDIPFSGLKYTWSSKRCDGDNIQERIDRALGNIELFKACPFHTLLHKPLIGSDHAPLIYSTHLPSKKNRPCFRFESMWTTHDQCESTIREAWAINSKDNQLAGFMCKLSRCADHLTKWSKGAFKNNRKKIADLTQEIERSQQLPSTTMNLNRQKLLLQELELTWLREEMFWHQRSRINWLNYGDRNSRFFHLLATHRGQKNKISGLKNSTGEWVFDQSDIQSLVRDHFGSIFTTMGPRDFHEVIEVLNTVVSDEMNSDLQAPVTDAEIYKAAKQLGGLKAPGEDGFSGIF